MLVSNRSPNLKKKKVTLMISISPARISRDVNVDKWRDKQHRLRGAHLQKLELLIEAVRKDR